MKTYLDKRPLRPDPMMTGLDKIRPGHAYRHLSGVEPWLVIYTRGGAGWARVQGAEFPLRRGDVLLFRPGAELWYGATPNRPWLRLWSLFIPRPHWLEWFDWPVLAGGVMKLTLESTAARATVCAALTQMHRSATGAWRRRGELALNHLERALLWCDLNNPRSQRLRMDRRVHAAVEFLCANLHKPLRLGDVAEAARLSPPHLSALFRKQVHTAPMRFLESQRMARARQLLSMTATPVGEVARQVGYANPFYFSLRFNRCVGRSPRAYRRSLAAPRR